jgi:ligand-binding SRPBCC domain-containing protein
MTTIDLTTVVNAPPSVCFAVSLDVDIELQAAKQYRIRAVSGVTTGVMCEGEKVTWKLRRCGLWISHTSIISGYDSPVYFQDRMVRGLFRSFEHNHFFHSCGPDQTAMRDEVRFSMPLWLLGTVSERLFVKSRLTDLLVQRNHLIKSKAETPVHRSTI